MYCLQLVETYTYGRGHAQRQAYKLATRQAQRVIISAPSGRVCSTVPLCAGTVPHAAQLQLQAHSWKSIDALTHKPSDHAQRSNEHAGRTRRDSGKDRHPIINTFSVLVMARVSRASYALSPPHCANEHEWLGQT